MLSNSARRNAKSNSTPSDFVSSSIGGAASGAPSRSGPCGPRYSPICGYCASHRSTPRITPVLIGRAIPVAMTAPHMMAMAKSQGDSRSRRSRYRRMKTGTMESPAEKRSPTTKSRAASAFREPTAAKMTAIQSRKVATSAKITGMATLRFRRGEPTSRRSRVESADLPIDLYHYTQRPLWQGNEQRRRELSGTLSGMQNGALFIHLDDCAEKIALQTIGDVILQLGNGEQAAAIARLRY